MALTVKIWHNPRCAKSRATLKLLEKSGHEIEVRRYLEDPPSAAEIDAACLALGFASYLDIARTKEKLFRELGLSQVSPEPKLLEALSTHPILIERPIVFAKNRAAIGRPPENVQKII